MILSLGSGLGPVRRKHTKGLGPIVSTLMNESLTPAVQGLGPELRAGRDSLLETMATPTTAITICVSHWERLRTLGRTG